MQISIIVPFYNTDIKYIEPLLNQLNSLDKDNFEVIFVNDGSNAKLSEFVRTKCLSFGYKYLSYENNKGVCYARNLGISNSSYDYISFIDSDDLVNVSYYQQMINHNESDLIIFTSDNFIGKANVLNKPLEQVSINQSLYKMYRSCDIKGIALRSACGKILSKRIIEENNLSFDTELRFYEDALFMSHYYQYVKSFCVYNNAIYHYRMNENSSSKKFNKSYISLYEKFYEKYSNDFKNNNEYMESLCFDTLKAMLVDKVVRSFKKWHYFYSIKVCRSKCVYESATYLLNDNLITCYWLIKLAKKIVKKHYFGATNYILLRQFTESCKIHIRKLIKK